MSNPIKILLSILLFLCLADMPYCYFQFVRFACLVGFAFLTYQSYQEGKETEAILFGILAVLFQPFFKIALGRELWNVVDVVVGVGLLVSVFRLNRNENQIKM